MSAAPEQYTLHLAWPVKFDELGDVLERIDQTQHGAEEVVATHQRFIGDSVAAQSIRNLVRQVAPTPATVLISGESGTGKEVIARQLHEQSDRTGEFVAVNCGAIPAELLESELFGHEKGAFTGATSQRKGRFEQADGGTLFLDEIGDMPSAMQVKLLRVLQERVIERVGGVKSIKVDVRIVAATHRDLDARIANAQFREDLYYRLNVVEIEIPPLREREADVVPLLTEIVRRHRARHGVGVKFNAMSVEAMRQYDWPGNVRELANLVERLIVSKPHGTITLVDLPVEISGIDAEESVIPLATLQAVDGETIELPEDGVDLRTHLANIERTLISEALAKSDGVVARAAKLLSVQRTTLVEKIKRYDL
ncbi:MAG: sigma-54 dependent transcriptional regulator [Pseudomonadota bacterium]